jgi:copper resistance protein D
MNALLAVVRAVHFITTFFPAGTLIFLLIVARPVVKHFGNAAQTKFSRFEGQLFGVMIWSIVLGFISGLVWLWVEAVEMSGLSWVRSLGILGIVLKGTQFGRVWTIRLGVAFFAYVVFLFIRRKHSRIKGIALYELLIAWSLSAMLVGTLGFVGHAAATTHPALSLPADVVHLLVAATWPVGLLPLAMFVGEARNSTDLLVTIPGVTRRFSALSLVSVGTLAASGLTNSWFQVGSVPALFVTMYGRWLLLKLMLIAVALSFGAMNLLHIKPALSATHGTQDSVIRLLYRNVVVEAFLGIAILLVVGVLGITPPAVHHR